MRSVRLSVAGLLGLILFCAFAIAALRLANEFWASATYSLTMLLLLFSILGLVIQQGKARASWLGFAVCGWGYLLSSAGAPWLSPSPMGLIFGPRGSTIESTPLLTTKLLEAVYEIAKPEAPRSIGEHVQVQWGPTQSFWGATIVAMQDDQVQIHWDNYPVGQNEWVLKPRVQPGNAQRFVEVGHYILAPVFGVLGVMIARWLWAVRFDGSEAEPVQVTRSAG
jgi:hypothetical protein